MKGIILAGGTGSRLYPLTAAVNKHLLPVAGKPVLYYPLALLMEVGVRDILVVSTPEDAWIIKRLLGDGSGWGITVSYAEQQLPGGVPQAIACGQAWSNGEPVWVALGDNIAFGGKLVEKLRQDQKRESEALYFSYAVNDPRPFGVFEFNQTNEMVHIIEKPTAIKPYMRAVPGFYYFGPSVFNVITQLTKTQMHLTIMDVAQWYENQGALSVESWDADITWIDVGTHTALKEAEHLIIAAERASGNLIGCLEAVALNYGLITSEKLKKRMGTMTRNPYVDYVLRLAIGT